MLYKDNYFCLDIDECAMKIDNCSIYTFCNNTEGSFNCTCKNQFRGNGNNLTGNYNIHCVMLRFHRSLSLDTSPGSHHEELSRHLENMKFVKIAN